MAIEEAIYNRLINTAAVTAITSTRIFPNKLPQWTSKLQAQFGNPYPAIRYQRISGEHYEHLGGGSGLADALIQIYCHAETYSAARNLMNEVREALDTYRGTAAGVVVRRLHLENDLPDTYDDPVDASDVGTHGCGGQFMAWYHETVPSN